MSDGYWLTLLVAILGWLSLWLVAKLLWDDLVKTDDERMRQYGRAEENFVEITRLRAALATARREGMGEAARLLEELHRNHGYNSRTGEVRRRGDLVTCPLTIEHAMAYYRAISEGVAHILAAAAKEGKP